jgi:cyclic-di-GMP-binding protein
MFGFLTSHGKDAADPLVSARATAVWLKQLPALDVIGRQQQVMRAFEAMRQSRRPIDPSRVQAIEFLDSALGADRRQLIKQYVENHDTAPKLAERIWQAIYDLTQGFMVSYQTGLEEAVAQGSNPRWKPLVPLLFARLLHYYGTDAKVRVFRFERWIPAKWMDLHRTYLRATELSVDRVPATLTSAGPNATAWTAEQEYLNVLLIHQLNTGNLSPSQLDWACSQLRAWSRKLSLDAVPRSPEGFFVDLAGRSGLVRRTGNDAGSVLRYLDTTPMAESLERAVSALRNSEATDSGPAAPINQQRVSVLEKVRPAVAPNVNNDLRKDPRVACRVSAKVRIGLHRISRELAAKELGDGGDAGSEQIEVFAVSSSPRVRRRVPDEHDSLAASLSSFSDPMWQVKDRSVAGLRIAASGGIGQALALGALVGVKQSDLTDWVLGVVRRLNKVSTEDAEAGVSIIAERVVPVVLHARREAREDAGIVVNGIDVSTIGARFDGLYLPPPSRPDKPLTVKTLIVPTSEYSEGRQLVLQTGRSVYTVALRQLVEQRSEWSWAAIQIVEKKAR